MFFEKADAGVAIVAGVGPSDFADTAIGDGRARFPVGIAGRAVGADLQDFFVTLDGVADLDGLLDRVGHRFLAIDMFAGFHGVDGNLGMPMVGSGD